MERSSSERRSTPHVDITASVARRWAGPRVPSGEQASDPRTSVGPRNEPRQGKPGSASTRTIASPRRSWKPPRAPDAESALKISKGFATESRLGAENSGIGSRVGLSSSCENSWNTRPRWLVCPWSQSTREHQPDLSRMWTLRENQPQEPVGIRVSCVWTSFACRPRRGSDRRVQSQGVRNGASACGTRPSVNPKGKATGL